MRALILTTTFLAAVLLAAPVAAHEGHEHTAMGTIESLDAEQITIVLTDEGSETFAITEETTFTRGDQTVSAEDATVGERAVVVYELEDTTKLAKEVKLPPRDE